MIQIKHPNLGSKTGAAGAAPLLNRSSLLPKNNKTYEITHDAFFLVVQGGVL